MTPVPAYFLGLQAIDIVLRGDRGFRALAARRHQTLFSRYRRQRRGVGGRNERCSAGNKSKGEFQKVAAFHDISLFVHGE